MGVDQPGQDHEAGEVDDVLVFADPVALAGDRRDARIPDVEHAWPDERPRLDVEEVADTNCQRPGVIEVGTGARHQQSVVGG
jgi:hypothetical protein